MKKKLYMVALQLTVCSAVYAQSAVLSDITCNPGANLNSAADDFIQFNLKPTAPVATYVDPYTYTLTATQNGVPVAVTTQSGAPATNMKYFADNYAPGFRLANGTSGNGNVILTVTPNWGGYPASTITLTDPGACTANASCGTKTVTYTFTADRDYIEFFEATSLIPKFNETDGKTLLSAHVSTSLNVYASNLVESIASVAQNDFNYRFRFAYTNLKLNGMVILNSSDGVIYQTPDYPAPTMIPPGVDVPATNSWAGDVNHVSTPSTIKGMKQNYGFDWLNAAMFAGLDPRLDPRWVENAAGNKQSKVHQPHET